MAEKKTMTLNLTEDEMSALEDLSSQYDMSKTAVIRKALRMFNMIDSRLRAGEKLYMEDVLENKKSELVVL